VIGRVLKILDSTILLNQIQRGRFDSFVPVLNGYEHRTITFLSRSIPSHSLSWWRTTAVTFSFAVASSFCTDFLVMEHLEGETLIAQIAKTHQPLALPSRMGSYVFPWMLTRGTLNNFGLRDPPAYFRSDDFSFLRCENELFISNVMQVLEIPITPHDALRRVNFEIQQ
jgi:hypothetical protein